MNGLTDGQKLLVREAQLDVAKAQIAFVQAQHAAQSATEKLSRIVDAIAKQMSVDEKEFAFNVDTLEFVPLTAKE